MRPVQKYSSKDANPDKVREGSAELAGENRPFMVSQHKFFFFFFYLCITAFLFILKGAKMFQFVFSDPSLELPKENYYIYK